MSQVGLYGGQKSSSSADMGTSVSPWHQGSVKAVSVRPEGGGGANGGGAVFASCGRDGMIALWDARESRHASRGVRQLDSFGEPCAVPTAGADTRPLFSST